MNDGHSHKRCYGTMLPVPFAPKTAGAGKVFAFEIKNSGGLGPPIRDIRHDPRQWDDCCLCPEFDHCYKFSMMKTVFEFLVHQE